MVDPRKVFGLDCNLSCLSSARGGGGFFFSFLKRALESKATKRDCERCVVMDRMLGYLRYLVADIWMICGAMPHCGSMLISAGWGKAEERKDYANLVRRMVFLYALG